MIDQTFFSPALPASPGPQIFAEPQALLAAEADFAAVFDEQAAMLFGPPVAERETADLHPAEAEASVEFETTSAECAPSAMPAGEVSLAAAQASFPSPEPNVVHQESEEVSQRDEASVAELSDDPFFDIVLLTEHLVQTLGRGEMTFGGVRDSFQRLRTNLSDFEWEVPAEDAPEMIEESNPFDSIAEEYVSMPAGGAVAIPPVEGSLPARGPEVRAAENEAIAQSIPEFVIEPAQKIAAPLPVPIAPSGKTGRPSPKTLDETPSGEPAKVPAIGEIREPEPDSLLDQTVLFMPVTPPPVWADNIPAAPEIDAENLISAPQAIRSDSAPASMPTVETFTAPAADVSPNLPPVLESEAQTKEITTANARPALKASNPMEGVKPPIQAASREFVSMPSSPIRQAAPENMPPVETQIPRPQSEAANPPLPQRPMERLVPEAGYRPQSPSAEAGQGDFVSPYQEAQPPIFSPGESEFIPFENTLPEAPQGEAAPVVIEPVVIEPAGIEPVVIEPVISAPVISAPVTSVEATPQHRDAAPLEAGPRPVSSKPHAAESEPLRSQPRSEKALDAPIEMKEPAPGQSPVEAATVEKIEIRISSDDEIAPVEKPDLAIISDEVAMPRTDAQVREQVSVQGEPRGPEPLEHHAEGMVDASVRGDEEVNAIRREDAAITENAAVPPVEPEAVLRTPSIERPVSQTQVESRREISAAPEVWAAPVIPQPVSFAAEELPDLMRNEASPESVITPAAELRVEVEPRTEMPSTDPMPQPFPRPVSNSDIRPAMPQVPEGPADHRKPISDLQWTAASAPDAQAVQMPATEIEAPAPIEGLRYERLESIAFRESFRPEVVEDVFRSVAPAAEPANTLRTEPMKTASPQLLPLQGAGPQPLPAEEPAQLAPERIESAMMTEAGSAPLPRPSMPIAPARVVSAIRPGRASLRIPDALRATESAIAPVHEEVRAEVASSQEQESAALPEMPVSPGVLSSGPREFTPLTIVPERNRPAGNGPDPKSSPAGEEAAVAAIDAPDARARLASEGAGRMQAERNAFRSLRMESQPRRAAGEAETVGAPMNFTTVFAEQVSLRPAADGRADLPESIARQVAEPMVEASEHLPAGNSRSLRLTLRPEEFGQVELQITRDADGRVHAVFAAERESASQALHEGIPHLRETLERAGLRVDQLIVNTGGQTTSSGQGDNTQTPHREFIPTRSSDSFEAEALSPGGEPTADDRLLNVHA